MEMTPERRRKIEQTLCDALGIPSSQRWGLTSDGGKSCYYPANSEWDAQDALSYNRLNYPDSWQARGEVHCWRIYPHLTEDWSTLPTLIARMAALGWTEYRVEMWREGDVRAAWFHPASEMTAHYTATDELTARYLAALKALGVGMPEKEE